MREAPEETGAVIGNSSPSREGWFLHQGAIVIASTRSRAHIFRGLSTARVLVAYAQRCSCWVKRMRRAGLHLDSQTLWDQVQGLARHLEPVLARLHGHLLSKDVVLVDEIRWPVVGTKGRQTKNWFVWSHTADDAVLYKIQNGRSNEQGEAILQDDSGVAVTDRYVVYDSLSKRSGVTRTLATSSKTAGGNEEALVHVAY